jgi:hypothetical protein
LVPLQLLFECVGRLFEKHESGNDVTILCGNLGDGAFFGQTARYAIERRISEIFRGLAVLSLEILNESAPIPRDFSPPESAPSSSQRSSPRNALSLSDQRF